MIKFIVGFILGCLFTFLICGITLMIRDDNEAKKMRQRRMNRTGSPWNRSVGDR